MDNILDNIGLPYSTMNTQHITTGLIGAGDADILVSLKENHSPPPTTCASCARSFPREFPGTTFYFLPADIVTQILNFGLPAPIDVQFEGTDMHGNRKVADSMLAADSPGSRPRRLRIQQPVDYPVLNVDVDRTKAAQGGYTERDVGSSILNIL